MRFRFTLFLLIANLVVFGLIWNNARRRNVEPPRAELVFPTDPDRIVATTGDAATAYTLVRDGTRWSLDKPYRWPANAWSVRKLLDQLRFIKRSGGFSLAEARRQGGASETVYGLDKPVCTLTVSAAGRDVVVKIGRVTDDGNARYMLANDGDTILPLPNSLLAALLLPPEAIRREEVFAIEDAFEVTSVSVGSSEKGPGILARLVRAKRDIPGGDFKSVWTFEIPVATDADNPLVKNALSDLTSLKYLRFFDATPERLAKAGLIDPEFSLTLDGNNRSQTLQVGGFDPDAKTPYRFAKLKDNPVIFTIPDHALRRWRELPTSMRDPHLLRFDDGVLEGVSIRIDGVPLVMHPIDVKEAPGGGSGKGSPAREWRMLPVPGGKVSAVTPVDPEVFDALVRSLTLLSARDIRPPAGATPAVAALCNAFVTDSPTAAQLREWGLDNPKWRVELAFRRDDKTFSRVLAIAPPVSPRTPCHARVEGSPTVYSIGDAIVAAPLADRPGVLSVAPETYRRRLLFAIRPGETLAALRILDLATKKSLVDIRKPDDIADWKVWLASRPERERKDVGALVDTLLKSGLSARAFLDKPFSEDFRYDAGDGSAPQPWRYRIEWEVKTAGGDDSRRDVHVLYATRRLGGATQLGGLGNASVVFTFSQEWVDVLMPLTFGRDDSVDVPTPADPARPDTDVPVAAPAVR